MSGVFVSLFLTYRVLTKEMSCKEATVRSSEKYNFIFIQLEFF